MAQVIERSFTIGGELGILSLFLVTFSHSLYCCHSYCGPAIIFSIHFNVKLSFMSKKCDMLTLCVMMLCVFHFESHAFGNLS